MTVDANRPIVPLPPAPSAPAARTVLATVAGAIQSAAQSTGASFDYLLATAKVESDLDPNLSARGSSATGLFQFIEQTWLSAVKQAGKALGLGSQADAIEQTASGRYVVKDAAVRQEIMQLRKDPTANALMAGAFTQQNAAVLANRIGRKPNDGELYMAHFFGPQGASKLIRKMGDDPTANAASVFPAAARANRPIFYDRQGSARSVSGVYAELARRYQVARAGSISQLMPAIASNGAPDGATNVAVRPAAPARDTAGMAQAFAAANVPAPRGAEKTDQSGPMFLSLFQTDDQRGAVAPVVAALWGAPTALAPAPQPAAAPTTSNGNGQAGTLDLFQDMRPNVRGLFDGSA
jgi:hypothetical protein